MRAGRVTAISILENKPHANCGLKPQEEVFLAVLVLFKIISANRQQGLALGGSYTHICLRFPQESRPHFLNPKVHFASP